MIHPAISEILVGARRSVELSKAAVVSVSRLIHTVTR